MKFKTIYISTIYHRSRKDSGRFKSSERDRKSLVFGSSKQSTYPQSTTEAGKSRMLGIKSDACSSKQSTYPQSTTETVENELDIKSLVLEVQNNLHIHNLPQKLKKRAGI
jgi:hypothetical protein